MVSWRLIGYIAWFEVPCKVYGSDTLPSGKTPDHTPKNGYITSFRHQDTKNSS